MIITEQSQDRFSEEPSINTRVVGSDRSNSPMNTPVQDTLIQNEKKPLLASPPYTENQ